MGPFCLTQPDPTQPMDNSGRNPDRGQMSGGTAFFRDASTELPASTDHVHYTNRRPFQSTPPTAACAGAAERSACVCTRRYRCRKSRAGEQKRILQRAYTIRSDVQARSVRSRRRIRRFNARRGGGTPFLIGRRGYHRPFVAGTSPPQSD